MKSTRLHILGLALNEIPVFASCLDGEFRTHGQRHAHRAWGAPRGLHEGLAGCGYALPLFHPDAHHYVPLADLERSIARLIETAARMKTWEFLVPVLTSNTSRYTHAAIARVFFEHGPIPDNLSLPIEYWRHVDDTVSTASVQATEACPRCGHTVIEHGYSCVRSAPGYYRRLCNGALVHPVANPA